MCTRAFLPAFLATVLAVSILPLSPPAAADLLYSTFVGGSWGETGCAIALDSQGNVVVAGTTGSWANFPVTLGAFDTEWSSGGACMDQDTFVLKMSPELDALLGSTYLGGTTLTSRQEAVSVAVDGAGNILVAGATYDTDFPATIGAYDTSHNGGGDTFVMVLSGDLTALRLSTFFGGSGSEWLLDLQLEAAGTLVLAGTTDSPDFPTTAGAFDRSYNGGGSADGAGGDAFVSRLSPDLDTLLSSTYLGGSDGDTAYAVIADAEGRVTVAGFTDSSDYPTTPGAFDRTYNGGAVQSSGDIFVSRLSDDLGLLLGSSYVGGSQREFGYALALDEAGESVVAGASNSEDFPTTPEAFDRSHNGCEEYYECFDIVLFRLSADFSQLRQATFLGGSNNEGAEALILDSLGCPVVTGLTASGDFPVTPGAFDETASDSHDNAILLKMSPSLSELLYSTYIGPGIARALAADGQQHVVLTGSAHDESFPATGGAYDTIFSKEWPAVDAFILKFSFWEGRRDIVTGPGPDRANPPVVRTFDRQWSAYAAPRYGVNVACGNLGGDWLAEVVTGPGPGEEFGPHVRAFSRAGVPVPGVSFLAYATHKFGVNVACGDLDADGYDEIVTGAGPGAVFGPHVRGWNVDGATAAPIPAVNFLAYGTHRWGVNVACGNLTGNSREEIVTGAGPGSIFAPHVRGWRYDGENTRPIPGCSFFAYDPPHWGVNVACGDLDGDGLAEIITGPGPGPELGTLVRAWNFDGSSVQPMTGIIFYAYANATRGVVVAAGDVDDDGVDEILTMPGPDPAQPAHHRAWNADGGQVSRIAALDFDAYEDYGLTHGGKVAWGEMSLGGGAGKDSQREAGNPKTSATADSSPTSTPSWTYEPDPQLLLRGASAKWDFASTRLRGWGDPDATWYHEAKFAAFCDEVARQGGNAVLLVAERSSGKVEKPVTPGRWGPGWERFIEQGGWAPQFGAYQPMFRDPSQPQTVNPEWLAQIHRQVEIARQRGLWAVLTLFCPYDFKWHGAEWWHPAAPGQSPYDGSSPECLASQLRAIDALLPALAGLPNLVLSDNWETGGFRGSVTLEWKEAVYAAVRRHTGAPYFVYVNAQTAGDVLAWINATPGIAGYHGHYLAGKNLEDLGLLPGKRLLNTEQQVMDLSNVATVCRWADEAGADISLATTVYRNFRRTDDAPPWPKDNRQAERVKSHKDIEDCLQVAMEPKEDGR